MQLSKHIGKAAWSTADKALYTLIGLAFILPQKMIGERAWGIYTTVQAILNICFALTDGFALQPMVNFGMEAERRKQAYTFSAILHVLFIAVASIAVYAGRFAIADIYNETALVPTLALFPLLALGFLLRNYFLKVAQLHLDPRSTFFMDLAWIGSTIGLIVWGWVTRRLATAEDMMIVGALSSGISSLVGLLIYGRYVRFTAAIDMAYFRRMLAFGGSQFLSAITLSLQAQGDILLLKRFTTSAMVGNYDAAKKIFRGFEAFRDAGSLLVYPGAAKLKSEGRNQEMVLLVEKMIGFSTIILLPIVLLVWLGPTDYLFQLVYKGKYLAAPMVFKVMSLGALAIPFSMNIYILSGSGEAARVFRVTVLSALIFFAAALVLIPMYGLIGAALTIVISYVAMGALATRSVQRNVPFTLRAAFGRWRDATDFALRIWKKRIRRQG